MGETHFMALHLEMENYVLVFVVYYFFSCENIKELRDGHVKDGLSRVYFTHKNSFIPIPPFFYIFYMLESLPFHLPDS